MPQIPNLEALRSLSHQKPRNEADHVKWFEARIRVAIKDFAREIPKGSLVRATVILPGGREILATWFGYHGPDMLIVHGFDDQQRDTRVLVVHSAVHIVLTAVSGEEKKGLRPIGFQSQSEPAAKEDSGDLDATLEPTTLEGEGTVDASDSAHKAEK